MQVWPEQRLTSSDAYLLETQWFAGGHHLLNLREREVGAARQEGVLGSEAFPGHAIPASEIAPVGDRNPQVLKRPAQSVDDSGIIHVSAWGILMMRLACTRTG